MKGSVSPDNFLRKAKIAAAHRRRRNPTVSRPVRGRGKIVTLHGNLAVVLPCEDGSAIGFAVVPTYKLVRLPDAEMARFAATPVYQDDPERRFQSAVARLLSEFAAIERLGIARARAAANGNGAAGNGHAYPPVNQPTDAIGAHPAE
jgi:hypothetical protein